MKASSRRRVLISSVAMLLVAMLALGTATFAWFTVSSSANASSIAATTSKPSELKLAKLDLVYNESITYGLNRALKPASSNNGVNWFTATAAAKTAYGANSTGFTAIDTTEEGQKRVSADKDAVVYVYDEMLNIKNFGQTAATGVTIKATVNCTNTARIAIVPCATAQTDPNTYSAITAANFKANIYSNSARTWSAAKAAGAVSATTTEASFSSKAASTLSSTGISVGQINAGATKSYRILVWFEGQDTNLYDTTTDGLKITSVSFTVTGGNA